MVSVSIAQLIVLQALLLGVIAGSMAFEDALTSFPICRGIESSPAGVPDNSRIFHHHSACVFCALASLAPLFPGDFSINFPTAIHSRKPSFIASGVSIAERREPRSSQGPPRTATV
ncbi:hypothetical protein CR492_01255 [Methylocella silvestris]|uniref:DUF2946 domain-containing protein n=1 Tax=Methylocella silvestris TaxID=199596 RepID=A0A2J7TLH1_METSI|nr:hypothetical protein CR492_01255 [Methylocella silvestris]